MTLADVEAGDVTGAVYVDQKGKTLFVTVAGKEIDLVPPTLPPSDDTWTHAGRAAARIKVGEAIRLTGQLWCIKYAYHLEVAQTA